MSSVRLPPPRPLGMKETLETLDHFKSQVRNFYRRDDDFKPFFKAGQAWSHATANYGLVDDANEEAADKAKHLEGLLTAIASHLPFPYLTTKILEDTKSMKDVFEIIYQQYQVQPSSLTFLDYARLRRQSEESPLTFYERLLRHARTHLAPKNAVVGTQRNTSTDTMTISLKNHVALSWIQRLHPDLLQVVSTKYSVDLRQGTQLAELVTRISNNFDALVKETAPSVNMIKTEGDTESNVGNVPFSSGSLGVLSFQSGSSTPYIERIATDEKMVKRIKQQLQVTEGGTSGGVLVNLANGVIISDIGEAMEKFFLRDYPKIAQISASNPCHNKTGANFLPPYWLSAQPGLVDPSRGKQKLKAAMDNNLLTQEQKRKREVELLVYKGEGPERAYYEKAKEYAEETGHELILFNGVHLSRPGGGEQESDFIMVDRTLGAVVVTEVKASLNQTHGTLQHAANQVDKTRKLLESWFGDLLNSFKFVGMVFGETLEAGITISPDCEPFIMVGEDDILKKMLKLKDELNNAGHSPATCAMDYRDLVKYLLFGVHANKSGAPVVSKMAREVHDKVMKAGTPDNIEYWSCWTPQQMGLMKSKTLRFAVFPSSMCTGKTECLVGKAIEKARAGEKVLVVIFGYMCTKTLLFYKLKKRFQGHSNIVVQYLHNSSYQLWKSIRELKSLILQFPDHHILGDELVLPEIDYLPLFGREVEQLRLEMEQDTGVQRILWIAVAGGLKFKPEDFSEANLTTTFKQFHLATFKIPLRGTMKVTSQCGNNKTCTVQNDFTSHVNLELPSNLVQGIAPAIFQYNSKTEENVVEAVRQAMELVTKEEGSTRGVALLYTSYYDSDDIDWVMMGVKAAGRATPLLYTTYADATQDTAGEAEVEEWMEGGEARPDLVADAMVSRGWEERCIVCINIRTDNYAGPENIYLRTISRLIIVKEKEKVEEKEKEMKSWPCDIM